MTSFKAESPEKQPASSARVTEELGQENPEQFSGPRLSALELIVLGGRASGLSLQEIGNRHDKNKSVVGQNLRAATLALHAHNEPHAIRNAYQAGLLKNPVLDASSGNPTNSMRLTKEQHMALECISFGFSHGGISKVLGIDNKEAGTLIAELLSEQEAKDETHAVGLGFRTGQIWEASEEYVALTEKLWLDSHSPDWEDNLHKRARKAARTLVATGLMGPISIEDFRKLFRGNPEKAKEALEKVTTEGLISEQELDRDQIQPSTLISLLLLQAGSTVLERGPFQGAARSVVQRVVNSHFTNSAES